LRTHVFSLAIWCPYLQPGFTEEDTMFADSMLETSWAQRSRRSWTTLSSFGLQAVVMGLLMLLPLLRPVALPFLKPLQTPISMTHLPGPPELAPTRQRGTVLNQSNAVIHVFTAPSQIPTTVAMNDSDVAPDPGSVGVYDPNAPIGRGSPEGVPGLFNSGTMPVPAPPRPVVQQTRVSHMMEGNLLRRVQPDYPPLARSARIQGPVLLAAVISKDGAIQNLQVLSGHPLLVRAAVEAVRQWHYRPYILNNEPVEVETRITVNFSLSGN
jgi:protein TonB